MGGLDDSEEEPVYATGENTYRQRMDLFYDKWSLLFLREAWEKVV